MSFENFLDRNLKLYSIREVTVVFDIDATAAAAIRNQLLPKLARENVVIAGPHMLFPSLGRLRKHGSGYSWAPVAFTDQWTDRLR